MKKRCLTTFLAVMCVTASAWGGIVAFDPLVATLPPEGGTVAFDVSLSSEILSEFDAANIVFGSNTALTLGSFVYDDAFVDMSAFVMDPPIPAGFYVSELRVGGFSTTGAYGAASVPFGTLTVTAGPFDPVGSNSHVVWVDSALDANTSSLILHRDSEPVIGFGVVNVTPEPAALTLLGLCGLGFLHRRRG